MTSDKNISFLFFFVLYTVICFQMQYCSVCLKISAIQRICPLPSQSSSFRSFIYVVFTLVFSLLMSQTIPGMESFAETAASLRGLPQMVGPFSLKFGHIDKISVKDTSPSKCSSFAFSLFFQLVIILKTFQVIDSINKCGVDIRRELFSSILVKPSAFLAIYLKMRYQFLFFVCLPSFLSLFTLKYLLSHLTK